MPKNSRRIKRIDVIYTDEWMEEFRLKTDFDIIVKIQYVPREE